MPWFGSCPKARKSIKYIARRATRASQGWRNACPSSPVMCRRCVISRGPIRSTSPWWGRTIAWPRAVVDLFQASGLKIFGPTKSAARIESSKAFAKQLMRDAGIPTADYQVFTDHDAALKYCGSQRYPLVVKASGLALGKGSSSAETKAKQHRRCMP